MIQSKWNFLILVGASLFASAAFADQNLRCDQKQTYCVVDNHRLTIGDEVAIINRDKEIVAVGEVRGMDGEKRRVNIKRKLGYIQQGAKVKTDRDGSIKSVTKRYRYYTKPAKHVAGASGSLARMNVGGQTLVYGFDAFYLRRWKWGSHLVGRAQMFSGSGIVGEADGYDEEFDFQGVNLLGGMAYEFMRKDPVKIRTEFVLGPNYVSLNQTSTSASTGSVDRVGDGVGFAARIGVDAVYREWGEWKPVASVGFSQVNYARSTSLGLGISKDL